MDTEQLGRMKDTDTDTEQLGRMNGYGYGYRAVRKDECIKNSYEG